MSLNTIQQPFQTGPRNSKVLRDYQHAARIFVDSNYRLSPKYGFLFYVEFDFNPLITNISNTAAQELGMIVKSVGLPKFTIDTKVHNAYNRKNIIQNHISYDPVTITFHDDQADTVRDFWYDYYSFFYRDSDYNDATYNLITKYQERPSFEWGYTPRNVSSFNSSGGYQEYQYIQAIRIYSMYQGNFSEYELLNPVISSFKHGDHTNGENSFLEHQMTINYETVKYQTGYITDNTVGGFIDLHYDNTPTPLGGTPQAQTNTTTVVDLADYNLNGGISVIPDITNTGLLNTLSGLASTLGSGLSLSAMSGVNSGGFLLPSLGSITSGLSSGAVLGQQLASAATGTSSSAGTFPGSTASGLGVSGTQVVGLAVAAISNPSNALKTVENMAIRYATGAASTLVNQIGQKVGQEVSQTVSGALGDLNSSLGQSLFGASSLTGYLSNTFSVNNLQADFNSLTNSVSLTPDSADTASLLSDSSAYDASAGWSA